MLQRNGDMETTTKYFNERLAELGIHPDDAGRHGLREDEHGNVEQAFRSFSGDPVRWLDKRGRNRKKIETIKNRRSFTEGANVERYYKELTMKRWTPAYLAELRRRKPDAGKYKFPSKAVTGYGPLPMPTNAAIDAYNAGTTGGTVVGVEGYFKAVAMSLRDTEAVAFTGISTYKVDANLADYLLQRQPDDFIILYDADARQLKQPDDAGVVDCQRVFNFYHSAANFSRQFFNFTKEHGIKTKLHFAMVAEDAIHKGVDDLLHAGDGHRIMADLHTLAPSQHFHVLRLGRSNYDQKLTAFFAIQNHVEFYRRYVAEIGARPFRFAGATYQFTLPERHFNLFVAGQGHQYFRLLDDPFHVQLDAEELTVDKFMTEANATPARVTPSGKVVRDGAGNIDNIINTYNKICIEAPTGTGKTSFFLGHKVGRKKEKGWFKRTGTRGVVAVPTVMLAKQLAAKYNIAILSGYIDNRKKEAALKAPVVVCTYDTLHHLSDLEGRVLVVDECHNLVNQYGEVKTNIFFRAEVLRRMVARFDVAAKTVLISGTPPKLLAKAMAFKYVRIIRRQNNMVNVFTMEAEKNSAKALTTAVLAELEKLDFTKDKIHFVYFNNGAKLELIKKYMVDAGYLVADDVSIVTREHVNTGHLVFNGIVEREEITGVKLVLSTCLIAEGININNRNIGDIYTVDINCPDSFRQYVARFRNMASVDVYDIRPPERRLDKRFFISAMDDFNMIRDMADAQLDMVKAARHQYMAEYDAEELIYWSDIRPAYNFRPELFQYIFQTDDGHAVDYLRMFAAVRERMMETGNNCFFYSQIGEHPNINIQGREPSTGAVNLDAVEDDMKAERHRVVDALKDDLKADPAKVVHAYLLHAGKSNNRHATKRIETMAGELITEDGKEAAAVYLQTNAEHFRQKWYKTVINRFLRLHFAGVEDELRHQYMDAGRQDFHRQWHRFTTCVEVELYNNRRHRLMMTAQHKAEVKFKLHAKKWIMDAAPDGVFRSDHLTELLNTKAKRLTLSKALDAVEEQPLAVFTEGMAEKLLCQLFDVEERQFHGFKRYTFREIETPPFSGTAAPSLIERPLDLLKIFS